MRCLRFTSRLFRVFSDKENTGSSTSSNGNSTELVKKSNSRSNLIPITAVKETHTVNINYEQTTDNKLINQYMLIKELGRGVHGKVKLGKNLETGELVVSFILDSLKVQNNRCLIVACLPIELSEPGDKVCEGTILYTLINAE